MIIEDIDDMDEELFQHPYVGKEVIVKYPFPGTNWEGGEVGTIIRHEIGVDFPFLISIDGCSIWLSKECFDIK